MNWQQLLTTKRLGLERLATSSGIHDRTEFQRDYDRIIFSSPFRRMQNKTQVFPLPGRIFVHNRLTHSLEVASVGRSLGSMVADKINSAIATENLPDLGAVVSAACLAHDMGNPPFGHSGESAIADFFKKGNGLEFSNQLTKDEWSDFTQFDGNANVLRLLTHQFSGKRPGGFALTYSTLASIVKYPFESGATDKQKFGFFQSEKEVYMEIANELGITQASSDHLCFPRHPLVYLVEAADDICYQIMDVEDAFKLGILSYEKTKELFLNFYDQTRDKDRISNIERTFKVVTDEHEQISYLRAGVIGKLVNHCVESFWNNHDKILNGEHIPSLINQLEGTSASAMDIVKKLSFDQIYNHRSVVEIEIAGYKIIGTLLDEFIGAIMNSKEGYSKKVLSLLPGQYKPESDSTYFKIQSVIDFVSGMTDVFALDLYRKIKGISLPEIV